MNERELAFYEKFKKETGGSLLFEAVCFHVVVANCQFKYTPDFYCPETGEFYEVVGSRQAFHQNKFKIRALRETFPLISIHIVRPDGKDCGFHSPEGTVEDLQWAERRKGTARLERERFGRWISGEIVKGRLSVKDLVNTGAVQYGTVSSMLRKGHIPTLKTILGLREAMAKLNVNEDSPCQSKTN